MRFAEWSLSNLEEFMKCFVTLRFWIGTETEKLFVALIWKSKTNFEARPDNRIVILRQYSSVQKSNVEDSRSTALLSLSSCFPQRVVSAHRLRAIISFI